jgi:hypothetical protein
MNMQNLSTLRRNSIYRDGAPITSRITAVTRPEGAASGDNWELPSSRNPLGTFVSCAMILAAAGFLLCSDVPRAAMKDPIPSVPLGDEALPADFISSRTSDDQADNLAVTSSSLVLTRAGAPGLGRVLPVRFPRPTEPPVHAGISNLQREARLEVVRQHEERAQPNRHGEMREERLDRAGRLGAVGGLGENFLLGGSGAGAVESTMVQAGTGNQAWQSPELQRQSEAEMVKRARLVTKRVEDEMFLWERDNMPTREDDRERDQQQALRHALNAPSDYDIRSGKPLNLVMEHLWERRARGIEGTTIPVSPGALRSINLNSGPEGRDLGIFRGGRVSWPALLAGSEYAQDRALVEQLVVQTMAEAKLRRPTHDLACQAIEAIAPLRSRLMRWREAQTAPTFLTSGDYVTAMNYLDECEKALGILRGSRGYAYVVPELGLQGNTVRELVQTMQEKGLRFAPAGPGDDWAYRALYAALARYTIGLEAELSERATVAKHDVASITSVPSSPPLP